MDALKMNILAGVVRHALGFTGAALVSAGYLSAESVTPAALDQVAGVVMMAASLLLSALDKAKVAKVVAGAKTPVVPEPVTPFENPTGAASGYTESATGYTKGFFLSERSLKNLEGVHPELVKIMKSAIAASPEDFVIVEGVRTIERQRELYNAKPKRSWTMNSKHLKQKDGFAHAVDFAIIENGKIVEDFGRYESVYRHVEETAFRLGVTGKITWGGSWKVRDLMHLEIAP